MSKNLYLLAICAWVACGIGASMWAASWTQTWELTWLFLIAATVTAICGTIIAMASKIPLVSLFGYALVAIPFGMLFGPIVAQYTTASLVSVLLVTTADVVLMGLIGAIIPDNLEGLGMWILGALIALLIGYLIVPFAGVFGIPVEGALSTLDWIGIALFSGIVIYDLNRAMRIPYTLDNAIDVALAVYLDWVNIAVRLVLRKGKKG